MTATDRRAAAVTVIVPGDLETRTGGYGYDRRIVAGLRRMAWDVRVDRLDDSFPFPTAAARRDACRALAAIPDRQPVLIDGLALGVLPDEVAVHADRLRIVALVHHPLALETGLLPGQAAALEISERRALTAARHVVVTSRATAATLSWYGVESARITTIEPGTDAAPLARIHRQHPAPNESDPAATVVRLLAVATVTPRKGYEVLLDALASIPFDNWRLRCAGSTDRDQPTMDRVRGRLADPRLAGRVDLIGDLGPDALAIEYDRADLFVLATLYEGYGMAVAEALARGLPVISTATGAIPDLVGDLAGIVVPPGDVAAFAAALGRAIGDADLRVRLAAGARAVRDRLPTWDDAAAAMARVLGRGEDADGG